MTQITLIRARNERYLAAMRADGGLPSAPPASLTMDERDALIQQSVPDDFLSKYGMIDRLGR